MRRGGTIAGLAVVLVLAAFGAARGARSAGPRASVELGNERFLAGDLDGAEAAYRAALEDLPDSAEVRYNLANVAQARGDFRTAEEGYRDALGRLRGTPGLERRILFNLGNNTCRRGIELADSGVEEALETLGRAALLFSEVIDKTRDVRKPDADDLAMLEDAKVNLEVVRLRIKEILDREAKKAEEASRPDVLRLVLGILASEQRVAAGADALDAGGVPDELRDRAREAAAAIQEKNLETTDRAIALLEEMLAAAATPPPTAGVPPPSGGAPPGVPATPAVPPNLEPAKESLGEARAPQEEALASLRSGDDTAAVASSSRSVDGLVETVGILDPLEGLVRRVEAAVAFEERALALTRRIERGGAPAARDAAEGREGENMRRSERAVAHVDAVVQAGGTPENPGMTVASDTAMREGLAAARADLEAARERQGAAREHLAAERWTEGAAAQEEALAHLRDALAKIREVVKSWVERLADALKLQQSVVFEAESARAAEAEGGDPTQALEGAEKIQKDAIETTERALDGLRNFLAQGRAAAGMDGAPPDPAYEEAEKLVAEGLVEEEAAASALNRRETAGALDPAQRAAERLAEALEKVKQAQNQTSPSESSQGAGESPPNQDQTGEGGEESKPPESTPPEDQPQPGENEAQEPPPEESKDNEKEPGRMNPDDAKRALAEILAKQEEEREHERNRMGRQTRPLPVEKDW